MVVKVGEYEFLVKESYDMCHGCFYVKEPTAVCNDLRHDIANQIEESSFNRQMGGCQLENHILIRNTPQGVLTYLQEILSYE